MCWPQIGYNHYAGRRGFDLPHTRRLLRSFWPEYYTFHWGAGSLTHADSAKYLWTPGLDHCKEHGATTLTKSNQPAPQIIGGTCDSSNSKDGTRAAPWNAEAQPEKKGGGKRPGRSKTKLHEADIAKMIKPKPGRKLKWLSWVVHWEGSSQRQ